MIKNLLDMEKLESLKNILNTGYIENKAIHQKKYESIDNMIYKTLKELRVNIVNNSDASCLSEIERRIVSFNMAINHVHQNDNLESNVLNDFVVEHIVNYNHYINDNKEDCVIISIVLFEYLFYLNTFYEGSTTSHEINIDIIKLLLNKNYILMCEAEDSYKISNLDLNIAEGELLLDIINLIFPISHFRSSRSHFYTSDTLDFSYFNEKLFTKCEISDEILKISKLFITDLDYNVSNIEKALAFMASEYIFRKGPSQWERRRYELCWIRRIILKDSFEIFTKIDLIINKLHINYYDFINKLPKIIIVLFFSIYKSNSEFINIEDLENKLITYFGHIGKGKNENDFKITKSKSLIFESKDFTITINDKNNIIENKHLEDKFIKLFEDLVSQFNKDN